MAVLTILACVLDGWGSRGTLAGNTEVRGDRGGSHSMAAGLTLETHTKGLNIWQLEYPLWYSTHRQLAPAPGARA